MCQKFQTAHFITQRIQWTATVQQCETIYHILNKYRSLKQETSTLSYFQSQRAGCTTVRHSMHQRNVSSVEWKPAAMQPKVSDSIKTYNHDVLMYWPLLVANLSGQEKVPQSPINEGIRDGRSERGNKREREHTPHLASNHHIQLRALST